jgi:hypothetical protein
MKNSLGGSWRDGMVYGLGVVVGIPELVVAGAMLLRFQWYCVDSSSI